VEFLRASGVQSKRLHIYEALPSNNSTVTPIFVRCRSTAPNPIRFTGETVRVYTGNAFDITGERRQTIEYNVALQAG
jgi:hypothetical protein